MSWVLFSSPFYRGSERFSYLPVVTQQVIQLEFGVRSDSTPMYFSIRPNESSTIIFTEE